MKSVRMLALGAAMSVGLATAAVAQDEPAAMEPQSVGKTAGSLMVRLRAIDAFSFPTNHTNLIGGDVEITPSLMPEVDATYFITDNIAIEAIAGVTHHYVKATDTALGDVSLGDVWLLPPTLTAQWHFFPHDTVSPYIGGGINYTWFWGDGAPNNGIVTDVDYSNNFGGVIQAGVDVRIQDNWYFNIDVKHVWVSTRASINEGAVTANVNVDPTIVGVGIGYLF